ncbi:hypothetical protein BHU74_11400 [Enterococcus faecalis]|uniref:DUF1149 family protein n=1 Tax=Enterococcus faecalis TaxID=1351 RepID=UPI000990C6B6|nr:DUF1149 family protein [Enterococcus faecalis]OOP46599.1 hypothetical protein BHU74_11400 [Enterococcus faecalis]
MEIKRQQEIVEAYHYDMRVPDSEVETDLRVSFSPIEVEEENYSENSSALVARLEFRIVFDEFVLSGAISQINHIIDRKIEKQEDISQEEVDELVRPLFSIVERLSYEVTEIALDRPGVQLNFQQSEEA